MMPFQKRELTLGIFVGVGVGVGVGLGARRLPGVWDAGEIRVPGSPDSSGAIAAL